MSWNPIVVGVDGSPESAWAAALGADIAQRGSTTCQLVHATRDVVSALALAELPLGAEEFAAAQLAHAREQVLHGAQGVVPTALLERIVVRAGRPAIALKDVAREVGAELVVLGGKHHSTVGRWLAGSTAIDAVRTLGIPLLVTARPCPDSARPGCRRCISGGAADDRRGGAYSPPCSAPSCG